MQLVFSTDATTFNQLFVLSVYLSISAISKEPIFFTLSTLVTKQLLRNVFETFQNDWILVEMLGFLLVVYRFFLMGFQLVLIHEIQQLKSNINEMFENGCK